MCPSTRRKTKKTEIIFKLCCGIAFILMGASGLDLVIPGQGLVTTVLLLVGGVALIAGK